MRYLALLRGINVGGNSMIRMGDLQECFEGAGFSNVRTYIQSGNVLFAARALPTKRLARQVEAAIEKRFAMRIGVAIYTAGEWRDVVAQAPRWWGRDKAWKHNLLALLPGTTAGEVIAAMGQLKPAVERIAAGPNVVYQSLSTASFNQAASSKLASHPLYRRITVRNYNTTMKLAQLLEEVVDR